MTTGLPAAYLALSLVILIWDVVLAGRIAQLRQASRPFAAITGIAGLLLLPAIMLRIAAATFITGRAVLEVDWIWPLILMLIAIQAVYAVSRHLVNLLWGIPIVVYDVVLAIMESVRWGLAHGSPLANSLAGLVAAQSTTLAFITQSPIAATMPAFFIVPIIAPAFPALRRVTGGFRAVISGLAFVWMVLLAVKGAPATLASRQVMRDHAGDRIRERPRGDFRVGVKIFPDVASLPSEAAVRNDVALLDSLDVRAICVVIVPGATKAAIDSVARILTSRIDDSATVIVAIGYHGKILPELRTMPLDEAARLRTIDYVVRKIHPDILLPAEDPLDVGARVVGPLPMARWQQYITDAARQTRAIDPKVRIGLSISRYGPADSALYAWAAQRGSPVDIVGFSLLPDNGIGDLVNSFEKAADRWMKTTPPAKDHWVFAAGGFPLSAGEPAQELAIWQTISWASEHPAIKGVIVYEASDYTQARGLRAPNGRLRPAARAVRRATRGLKESISG